MWWTREQIKTRAKAVLRGSYWKAFLVSIIMGIAGGSQGGFNVSSTFNSRNNNNSTWFGWQSGIDNIRYSLPFIISIFAIAITIFLIIICFRIFIGYSIEVGGRRYFIRSAEKDVNLNNLGYSFNGKRYINIIKTMLYRGVLVFLWSLLLLIPGIIKAYAYILVPYILADNPQIGYKRALEISAGMTDGEKFNIWVLELSFIGWYLLGALALGVGVLFVVPYVNATEAELYLVLKEKAINNGVCSAEELMADEFTK